MRVINSSKDVRNLIKNDPVIRTKIILSGFKGFSRAECRYLLRYSVFELLTQELNFDSYDLLVESVSNNRLNPLMNFDIIDKNAVFVKGRMRYFSNIWIRYKYLKINNKYILDSCSLTDNNIEFGFYLNHNPMSNHFEERFGCLYKFFQHDIVDSNSKYWLSSLYR